MATIILTAAGTAVGGPIGGAVGAIVGQAIDQRLFREKGRDGPRLTDLAVQTSSYGTPIPQLFGTMRVAGTVIWSTDLIEHAAQDGGGKGRSGGTRYSSSASFAVLLSARAIRSVGRIWADGRLLRGAAGDLKVPVRMRLYLGDEDQAVDPLIASAIGLDRAPACRGQAYAVFEDLGLGDFGNRIPSLTFEVTADADDVDCAEVVRAMSGQRATGESGTRLAGYSGYGESVRGPLAALLQVGGAWLREGADGLTVRAGAGASVAIADVGAGRGGRGVRAVAAADTAPRAVTLQHHDPARDYQVGLQRVRRAGSGARELAIELPAAVDAGTAKGLAAAALARIDAERERRTVALDWRALGLVPGDRVTIIGEPGLWRVVEMAVEHMVVTVELVRVRRAPVAVPATSGAVLAASDAIVGATVLEVVEMLPADGTILTAPRLTVAAAGRGPGWRQAALQISLDGGVTWEARGTTAGPAVLGRVVGIAGGPGSATLVDRRTVIEVDLLHDAMLLAEADAAALDADANLAMVGAEIIQFGSAERIGPRRWRLRDLWRGRLGTEWAIDSGGVGQRFVLLDAATSTRIDLPSGVIGREVRVMASGVGDGDTPAIASIVVDGASVAPPTPVHLTVRRAADGSRQASWVRRSRAGWVWGEGIDTPLAEERETYAVAFEGSGAGEALTTETGIVIPTGATAVSVRQAGTTARSRPVRLAL
ncbi:phage tail protein [Sphingomonas floccifaciens]|uniref:Phage tail protein n=1 Tax=Sphingomonas floccifaciens TaxID=1844115 RepID=A0ABW4NFJ2_9SPHN